MQDWEGLYLNKRNVFWIIGDLSEDIIEFLDSNVVSSCVEEHRIEEDLEERLEIFVENDKSRG